MARRGMRRERVITDREWTRTLMDWQDDSLSLRSRTEQNFIVGSVKSPLEHMREATILAVRGEWFALRGDSAVAVQTFTLGAHVVKDSYVSNTGPAGTPAWLQLHNGPSPDQLVQFDEPLCLANAHITGTLGTTPETYSPTAYAGVGYGGMAFESKAKRIVARDESLALLVQVTNATSATVQSSYRVGVALSVLWGLK